MSLFQALVLGLTQGITEFLPISSSAHLVLFQHFFGLETPPVFFDITVHLATLSAVIIFFFPQLKRLNLIYFKHLFLGTLPAVIAGLFLQPHLEKLFSSLWIVAFGLAATSLLLFSSSFVKSRETPLTPLKSLIIGGFQALAIIPGISRSGSTVIAGLHLHLSRTQAFSFSFLLSIPAILGATLLQAKDLSSLQPSQTIPLLIGFVSAALAGFASLKILQTVIAQAKLHLFGFYCFILSMGIFTYLFLPPQ